MYAVVETKGRQYKIAEGDEFDVDMLSGKSGDEVKLEKVLLVVGDKDIKIGTPYVEGALCVCSITAQLKDKKINILKYRRRKASKTARGHRRALTKLKVEKISVK